MLEKKYRASQEPQGQKHAGNAKELRGNGLSAAGRAKSLEMEEPREEPQVAANVGSKSGLGKTGCGRASCGSAGQNA